MSLAFERSAEVADSPKVRSLTGHVVGLALVLLALAPLIGAGSVYSADEGAAMLQANLIDQTGDWSEPNKLPVIDPDGDAFGVHLAKQYEDGSFAYFIRRPAYPFALSMVAGLGLFGAISLSILGTVASAAAAGRIMRHWKPELDVVALWVTGLASPLMFNSFWAIAHTIAAGLLGWSVVMLLGAPARRTANRELAVGALLIGAAVLFRSEAILYGIALTIALLVVDGAVDRRIPLRGFAAGAGTVGGVLVNKALVGALFGPLVSVVTGTTGSAETSWLADRIRGFKLTVLSVTPSGFALEDLLLVLAIGLAVVSVLSANKDPESGEYAKLAFLAAGLAVARTAIDPTTVVRGLLMAFPLVAIGAAAMSVSLLRTRPAMVIAIASTLFFGAVVLTQHREGGSAEFGGRYFAVMLPVLTPLLVAAASSVGRGSPADARRGWRVAIGVLMACTVVMGLLGLHRSKDRVAMLVDAQRAAIEQVAEGTGEPPVVVSTINPASRWSFELYPDSRWLLVDDDQLTDLVDTLANNNVEQFVVVGSLAEGESVDDLGGYRLTGTEQPLENFPLTVSVYAE